MGVYPGDGNDPASFCVVCGHHLVYLMVVTELLERQGQILEGQSVGFHLPERTVALRSVPTPPLSPVPHSGHRGGAAGPLFHPLQGVCLSLHSCRMRRMGRPHRERERMHM